MTFSVENIEVYLLVLMRISAFVLASPIFSYTTVPRNVKFAISLFLTIMVLPLLKVAPLQYVGILGYSALILKETAVGIAMGYVANVCVYILNFAGQLMDMEMGLSMASQYDPLTNIQSTISGSFYTYMVTLTMIVTNMHYYLICAVVDSFDYFGVGDFYFNQSAMDVLLDFMPNFFIIAFRIILPVFGSMLIINVVLAVLSKAAPQMNMFVVGMQLKVITGVLILVLLAETVPMVSDFIVTQMKDVLSSIIRAFANS